MSSPTLECVQNHADNGDDGELSPLSVTGNPQVQGRAPSVVHAIISLFKNLMLTQTSELWALVPTFK